MPILVVLAGLLIGAVIWWQRAKMARDAADELLDVATTVRGRIRQAAFKRKAGTHPADTLDDPRDVMSSFALATALETESWSSELEIRTVAGIAKAFRCTTVEAREYLSVARWVVGEGRPEEVRRRLSKRLPQLVGAEVLPMATGLLHHVAGRPEDDPTGTVAEAERQLRQRFPA